ncbi:hypothetical protein HJB80_02795 [Rhizobium lentis]|uniref:hypothetical protein n=1 Tax=Rhizobium lentis TaxID=1138194 RepID=UPI001C83B787|nr:hypothetical protein [Rhizobium lentis]MBX5131620.1 hypothetical protein [Rhizobium lentis]
MAKAASKAERRRKRGRPIKQDVARTDSGRISRAANANEPPDKVAKEARMRLHGVSKEDASQPEAGTVIGRMKLSGELSKAQYDGLIRYSMTRERYMIAMGVPDSLRTRAGGVMNVAPDESDIGAVEAWGRVHNAVSEAQRQSNGNLVAALNFMVTRDEYYPHMVGDLRVVSNALVRHYGIDAREQIT